MELIEASKVHEIIIDYRDKATDVESEIELERAYGANDVGVLISQLPAIEAIPKADYENRLKVDMVAMLEEISLEIDEMDCTIDHDFEGYYTGHVDCQKLIREKINALKGDQAAG